MNEQAMSTGTVYGLACNRPWRDPTLAEVIAGTCPLDLHLVVILALILAAAVVALIVYLYRLCRSIP